MKPDTANRRADESEDLQESANHPDKQLVHSSESAHLPVQVSVTSIGGGDGSESSATKGATDHNRKTEHSQSSEKGHQQQHTLHSKVAKGHDHERHSAKHDEHHKETENESHRHDTQAHDKGGATQQGIRERTEIEYYEREHFLDTEYDKAKLGHDKTHGVKEHESHHDHDSHEDKKVHAKDDSHSHKTDTGDSVGKAIAAGEAAVIDAHGGHSYYTPPIPVSYQKHPHVAKQEHSVHEDSHAVKEDAESSRLHHSEESKGHREHNSEKDVQTENKDKGYVDKDKGRRKEGYRERGYKITAEREYFLNDAHHDKGHASHTSGHKLKDQEGAAHGTKEGERDRGFTKEEKKEEAHDAAYDAKDHHYYDGEAHSEGFASEKASASSGGEKKQKEEVIPLAPPVVNYVEDPHSGPLYPLPIVYAPSNDGAQAVVAYPPENLTPLPKSPNNHRPSEYDTRQSRKEHRPGNQQPLGGYDDEPADVAITGYVGHATYKKRNPSPLVSSIRDNVRNDVHAKPPSYSKSESTSSSENSVPSSENSVRFPNEEEDNQKYQKESEVERVNDEVIFPQEEEKVIPEYSKYAKDSRGHSGEQVYYPKKMLNPPIVKKEHPPGVQKDLVFLEEPQRVRPEQKQNPVHNVHPHIPNVRQNLGNTDSRSLYMQGAQNADKLIRSAYPQIQATAHPTVSDLIQELTGYTQQQDVQRYPQVQPQRNVNDNAELTYADLHHLYNLSPGSHEQRQHRAPQNYRSEEQTSRNQKPVHQPALAAQNHQKQQVGRYNQLIQNSQQQASLEQLQQHHPQRPAMLHHHPQQQQQTPRTLSVLEQLTQQTKPPFSPVVLLSRGPPAQKQNQAVDIWYTRQKK
ncbi:uncharacterized protein TNCV_1755181 [Trichonephila clavipes]|nr:uncharacterized protein TNCV_1755181 [Trichonephila clavipes]